MFYKFILFTVLATSVKSGIIPLGHGGNIPFHGDHGISLNQGHASSYMHFHGPVEGPVYEIKVPYVPHHNEHAHLHGHEHEDHGYTLDYVAHPKYEFSYGVEDHHTGDVHGHKESRDGKTVTGEYSIKEPGGNVRTVKYRAGVDGFHAVVHNSGGNDHSGGVYGSHGGHGGHEEEQNVNLGHEAPVPEEQLQEYAIYQGQEAESDHHAGYL